MTCAMCPELVRRLEEIQLENRRLQLQVAEREAELRQTRLDLVELMKAAVEFSDTVADVALKRAEVKA